MPACSAFGCNQQAVKGHKMFSFPRNPERRKLWELKVSRAGWIPNANSRLCEKHFDKAQFEWRRTDKKLRHDAVPTIFSYRHAKPVKKSPKKRQLAHFDTAIREHQYSKQARSQESEDEVDEADEVENNDSCLSPMPTSPVLIEEENTIVEDHIPSDHTVTVSREDQIGKLQSQIKELRHEIQKKEKRLSHYSKNLPVNHIFNFNRILLLCGELNESLSGLTKLFGDL